MAEPQALAIRRFDPTAGELDPVLELLDAELGRGLYGREDMERAAADPTALVLVAFINGAAVAAAIGRLQLPADVHYYAAFGETARLAFGSGSVGSLEALAVAPAARRRGLGSELIRRRVEWFRERSCRAAVAIAWMPVTHPRGFSAPLFRELGFREGPTIPDFYREESARDGWSCPADGTPCRCPAVFFWLPL